MNDKDVERISDLDLDVSFIINESFLGYKYRKKTGNLYNSDSDIPKKLISMYYGLDHEADFDTVKEAFINRYIKSESELEEVDDSDIHGREEKQGLGKMYEYIHSKEINNGGIPPFSFKYADIYESQKGRFNIWSLQDLHEKLYSLAPHPEGGGKFRNYNVYLPNTGTNLLPWDYIEDVLRELDFEVQEIQEYGEKVIDMKKNNTSSEYINSLFSYIEKCVKLNCDIIKIHPFPDGNGRTVRGFINKLFEDVGLPPIYIKPNERTEYHQAMNKANNENNYSDIINFYHYKICDSIIELDINDKVKEQRQSKKSR